MKYNRAFIIRNEVSIPVLEIHNGYEDSYYWLFESGESFHGEHSDEFFYFKDSRIPSGMHLPLSCVELEFSEADLTEEFEEFKGWEIDDDQD